MKQRMRLCMSLTAKPRISVCLLVLGGVLACGLPAAAQSVLLTAPVGGNPIRVAVNAATNRVYVTNWLDGGCAGVSSTLTVVNGSTYAVEAAVPGACHPWGLAVNEASNHVLVANFIDVRVFDGATNTLMTAFQGGSNENSLAINPVSRRVYVGVNNCVFPGINVFSSLDYSFITSIPLDGMPLHMAVNAVTNRLYVTKQYGCPGGGARVNSSTLSVIDGLTNTEQATVPIGVGLQGVAVDDVANRIYAANPATSTLAIIDGYSSTLETLVPVGGSPRGVAVNPATRHIYVTNFATGALTAIEASTNCRATLQVGAQPQAVAINTATRRVYVANSGSGTLSVIDDPETEIVCDSLAPAWPAGSALTASNIGLHSLTLNWTPAIDNIRVVSYKLFQAGLLRATLASTILAYGAGSLASCTEYAFTVEACDAEGNCSNDGPSLTATTLTPIEALDSVANQVNAFAAEAVLNQGQAAALIATLQAAVQQLNEGRLSAAAALLRAFLSQVNVLVNSGSLSPAQGQLLTGLVAGVIASPTCAAP